MGFCSGGALATRVITDRRILIPVPDAWSLEDAATVPIVYGTVLYALVVRGNLKRGQSVLIHAGSGGIGQAAINVCLHYGCNIFTTVGTKEKREFIIECFPEIQSTMDLFLHLTLIVFNAYLFQNPILVIPETHRLNNWFINKPKDVV